MGSCGQFKQVSPVLLDKLIENPDFVPVFIYAKSINQSDYKQKIKSLVSKNLIEIVLKNPFGKRDDDNYRLLKINLNLLFNFFISIKQVLGLEQSLYKRIEPDIDLILKEGRSEYCDLDKCWSEVDFLLSGSFLNKKENNLIIFTKEIYSLDNHENLNSYSMTLVNAVCSRTEIQYTTGYGAVKYFMPHEVKDIATALSIISTTNLNRRWRILIQQAILQGREHPENMDEEDFNDFIESFYKPLEQYFKDAANKNNGMIFYLT